jgi:hypothetical protein
VHPALIDGAFATLCIDDSFGNFIVREPWDAMTYGLDAGSRS